MNWTVVGLLAILLLASTILGALVVRYARSYGWGVLTTMLAGYLAANTALAPRAISVDLGFVAATLLSGTVIWPFTAQIVDMVNEVYGRRRAYVAAAVGYLGRIAFVGSVMLAMYMTPLWPEAKEVWWRGYFGQLGRILFAGAISYGLTELVNVYVFSAIKNRVIHKETSLMRGLKFGLLRTVTNDLVISVVDSPVFYIIAFAGVLPWNTLVALCISAIAVKLVIGMFNQPFYVLYRGLIYGKVQRDL